MPGGARTSAARVAGRSSGVSPGQHHHVAVVVAVVVGQAGQGHRHGVPGPPLLDLLDELDGHARRGVLDQRLGHPLGPVAHHHHHPVHRQLGQGVEHVEHHGAPAQPVQRLGTGRAHPGPLAGGQHHRGERPAGHGPSGAGTPIGAGPEAVRITTATSSDAPDRPS